MPLTLIRRPHDSPEDAPWIRADTWEQLAAAIGATLPTTSPLGFVLVSWPDGRVDRHDAGQPIPPLPEIVRAWACYGYRWATISGTAPTARSVRGVDQAFEDLIR